MYRLILWDFDGVLFDSNEAVLKASNAIYQHHGFEPESFEEFRHRKRNGFKHYVDRGIPWSIEEIRNFYFERYDSSNCRLTSGVPEILEAIRVFGAHCGIVSAHHLEDVLAKVQKFEIHHHFRQILGGVSDKASSINRVCTELGVLPEDAIYVGDLQSDVLDGKSAGVTTVLFAPANYPYATEAHHHISEIGELRKVLGI